MSSKFRKSPLVCLGIAVQRLLLGKLRLSQQNIGKVIQRKDGREFTIFRHITVRPSNESKNPTVLIVSFKFARLSHNTNKIASLVPMLLIAGFPGFMEKMYAVNSSNGYWQGMYQWESGQALEEYKRSFVFKMMNRRAQEGSVSLLEINSHMLTDYINKLN